MISIKFSCEQYKKVFNLTIDPKERLDIAPDEEGLNHILDIMSNKGIIGLRENGFIVTRHVYQNMTLEQFKNMQKLTRGSSSMPYNSRLIRSLEELIKMESSDEELAKWKEKWNTDPPVCIRCKEEYTITEPDIEPIFCDKCAHIVAIETLDKKCESCEALKARIEVISSHIDRCVKYLTVYEDGRNNGGT